MEIRTIKPFLAYLDSVHERTLRAIGKRVSRKLSQWMTTRFAGKRPR